MIAGVRTTRLQISLVSGLLAIVSGTALSAQAAPQAPMGSENDKAQAARYGKLPINIEFKEGSTDNNAESISRGGSYGLHLTSEAAAQARNRAVFAAQPAAVAQRSGHAHGEVVFPGDAAVATPGLTERGSNAASVEDKERLPHAVHYSAAGDLIEYGNRRQREDGFAVTQSADLKQVQVQFLEITRVKLEGDGEMIVPAEYGDFAFTKDVNREQQDRQRDWLAGRFTLGKRHRMNLSLSGDAPPQPLVTNPVLTNSKAGISGSEGDLALVVAAD